MMTMDAKYWKGRCDEIEEEKRELLVRLYRERGLKPRCKTERPLDDTLSYELREKAEITQGKDELKVDIKERPDFRCKDEPQCHNCTVLSEKVQKLMEEIEELKTENSAVRTSIKYAEGELSRLAESLHAWHTWYQKNFQKSSEETQVLKHQVNVFKEDFDKERRDRERAQGELGNMKEKIKEMEEIINVLTQQVDIHKEDYSIQKAQNQILQSELQRKVDQTTRPQVQFVYPLLENQSFYDRTRRSTVSSATTRHHQTLAEKRRNLRTMSAPPLSFYYGGDVVVD